MYFFCPKCSQKCSLAEGLKCSNCASTTGAGIHDNFYPKHPELAVTRGTDVVSGSKNQLVLNSMSSDITVLEKKRKRNKSGDGIIRVIIPNDQGRQEICKETDKTHDLMKDREETRPNFLSNEYQLNIGKLQESQMDNASVKKALLNESRWNIGEFQGSEKDNALVSKTYLNTESPGSEKVNEAVKILDSTETIRKSVHSIDDMLAVAGPSEFNGNQNEPNSPGEKSKSIYISEIKSAVLGKTPKIFRCKICREHIEKHTRMELRANPYFCCVCEYDTFETTDLQIHIDMHFPKKDCYVCTKEYTERSLHFGVQICAVCSVTFNCMTELDEHSLVHGEYFAKNCWGCRLKISEHITEKQGNKVFYCCMCGYECNKYCNLISHNRKHRPKIFCKTCKEEYPEEQSHWHNGEYPCVVCSLKFLCRTELEDHYQEELSHVVYFSQKCRLCNRIIKEHVIECKEKQYYKCCYCPQVTDEMYDFRRHLWTHSGLDPFKCVICGNRYPCKETLSYHSLICKPFSYTCGTCRMRFPSEDSLTNHHFEKHSLT